MKLGGDRRNYATGQQPQERNFMLSKELPERAEYKYKADV